MESEVASRLCEQCGMCCNGVLFHTVRILPEDSVAELSALGLKCKRQKGERWLLQPCRAHGPQGCSIYKLRPTRCRLFECGQLRRVLIGQASEAEAMEKIAEVKKRVASVEDVLAQSGKTDPRRPLSKRVEKIKADPVGEWSEPGERERRDRLLQEMNELEAILDRDFRVEQETRS